MCRQVHRELTRNALRDLTTSMPATTYHRRSYAERYSRYNRTTDGAKDEGDNCVDRSYQAIGGFAAEGSGAVGVVAVH